MQKQYKTKVSQKILEYIQENSERGFNASEIYAYLTKEEIQVNLATIYRNLDKLAENKLITKFKASSSDSVMYRYAGNRRCQEHLHMQCRVCGRIYHLEGDFMNEIAVYLRDKFGFELECEASSLGGICKNCISRSAIN